MAHRALKRRHGKGLAHGQVRALLFPRGDWSIEDALIWASLHGFNTDDYDVVENYIRVHPHGRGKKGRRVKTVPYGVNGLRAVVEWR